MGRRLAKYDLLKATERFEVVSNTNEVLEGTCGNIQSLLFPLPKNINDDYKGFYDLVSAPMLLARLCAAFAGLNISVEGQPGYKITWVAAIKHKSTGCIITFYDYKGAASIGSDHRALKSKALIKDIKKLVAALADERFPHPYDGCVVGEVA